MEILLLQDVNGIGKKNDLLVVGDGFALNCLLPQRKALVATPTVRRRYAEVIRKRAEEKEKDKQRQTAAASVLVGKQIEFTRKSTKTGKLYAGITESNISEAIKDQLGLELSEDAIELQEHIKAVGIFTVQVAIGGGSHPLKVEVKAEK